MSNEDETRDPLEVTNPDELTKDFTPPDSIAGAPPPQVVVVQPPAGGGGGRRKGGGAGGGETKKTPLQNAMPSPERVKITKRRDDGSMAYIGHYAWADVSRFKSLELFISQKLVPRYRGGEYEVAFVKADGTEAPPVPIAIETPTEEPVSQVAPLDQVLRLAKQLQEDAERSRPTQPDPVAQLQQLLALQKQMGGGDAGGMMPMLMMMMMSRQSEPKPDPMESAFRMLEAVKALTPPPPPLPPMPMMPSGPDPSMTIMIEMMKMNAESTKAIVESIRHQDKGPGIAELLHLSQAMSPKDQIGARDILPMISTMKDLVRPPERDTLADQLAAFKMVRQEIKEMNDDGRSSGFRELAESVLPEGVESITKLIQAIRSKEAATAQDLQQPLQGQTPQQQRMPKLPPGFQQYAQDIVKSKDPVDAMGATLRAFLYLGQSPDYRPALETLVRHARGGEKDEALDLIGGFLEGIGRAGLITEQAANFAMQGFDEHWDEVVTHLLGGQAPPKTVPKAAPKPPQRRTGTGGSVVGHPPPTEAQVIPIVQQPIQPIPGQAIVTPPSDGTTDDGAKG